MKLQPIKVTCPVCNSDNITYTCEPKCCFNHICDSCYSTFELFTETLGRELEIGDSQPEERDSLAPTVACARCQSLDVYLLEEGKSLDNILACVSCHALLRLVFDSIESRQS